MPSFQPAAVLDATFPAQPSQVPAIRRAVAEIARERGAPHIVLLVRGASADRNAII